MRITPARRRRSLLLGELVWTFGFFFWLLLLIETASAFSALTWVPQRIVLDQISVQYPMSFTRKLFSSVPVRDYALYNITMCIDAEMLLLTGASSSGKSTILQTILNRSPMTQQQQEGTVTFCSQQNAVPAYLDALQRPTIDNQKSIRQKILMMDDTAANDDDDDEKTRATTTTTMMVFDTLLDCVQLSSRSGNDFLDDETTTIPYSQLSPSEQYRLQLVQACLQSLNIQGILSSHHEDEGDDALVSQLLLPAPILLLDEWLDKETSVVIHNVQDALQNLVDELGAIVCIVTHKPERFRKQNIRNIVLCRGKILSDSRANK